MTNFKKQLFSVLTAGAMVVNTAGPAFAGTTLEISGNGAGSDNFVEVEQNNNVYVDQTNDANVENDIKVSGNTGNNDASFNTGGDVVVDTGNANANVTVNNALNSNTASVDGCCNAGNTDVLISGNGAGSLNNVKVDSDNEIDIEQDNDARVENDIDVDLETGRNDANANTGGDVLIQTGSAKANVDVMTMANANVVEVGRGASVTPTLSFRILGNGAGSDNYITAYFDNETEVEQDNYANIDNYIDVDAETGDNDAGFNTGGDVYVLTGNAEGNVDVDNMVNFNAADLDCGCVLGNILAKISGNGAEWHQGDRGDNVIKADFDTETDLEQDNDAYLDNDVDVEDLDTGDNESNKNTGAVDADSDPAIVTGNSTANVDVDNNGNQNVFGDIDLDDMLGDMDFEFDFNMHALLAFFGLSM